MPYDADRSVYSYGAGEMPGTKGNSPKSFEQRLRALEKKIDDLIRKKR